MVSSDIATYSKPNEQPTSGAGAVALLIGPNPLIEILPQRASNFMNSYDFFKPDPKNNHPLVRGKDTIDFYIKSLILCWQRLKTGFGLELREFDFFCFHSPFTKQARKGFLALLFYELVSDKKFASDLDLDPGQKKKLAELYQKGKSFYNQEIQKIVKPLFRDQMETRVEPALLIPAKIGNIYTGSLYLCLISLVFAHEHNLDSLRNKRVFMYSYGSGLASTVLNFQFTDSDLSNLIDSPRIRFELDKTNIISCSEYFKKKKLNAGQFGKINFSTPVRNVSSSQTLPKNVSQQLWLDSYYLSSTDNEFIRDYVYLGQNQRFRRFNCVETQSLSAMKLSNKKKLRQLSLHERQEFMSDKFGDPSIACLLKSGGLSEQNADLMTENCVGRIALPLSIITDLRLNGKNYTVPMSTEEASVVAAANLSVKVIRSFGEGFWGQNTKNVIRGQIYVVDFQSMGPGEFARSKNRKIGNTSREFFPNRQNSQTLTEGPNKTEINGASIDIPASIRNVVQHKNELLNLVNEKFCPNMHKLGGGAFNLYCNQLDTHSFGVSLLLDVVDAMGANTINTTLEKMKPYILSKLVYKNQTNQTRFSPILMSICSNLTPERVTRVGFRVPVSAFDSGNNGSGMEVCKRICMATRVANLDLFRTITHNKGIMNGITGVLLALGQDTRAVEAACHVYSIYRNGRYQTLSEFYIEHKDGGYFLCGELEVPLSLGTVGGVLGMNPLYQSFLKNMKVSSSMELSQVVGCIGLANNLAAIRALVTDGIQKGHMKLHAKNLAFSVGVPLEKLQEAVQYMEKENKLSMAGAKEFLEKFMNNSKIKKLSPKL